MGVNLFHNKPPPTSIGFSVTTNLVIPRISMRLRIAQNVTHTWEKFLGKVLLQVREEVNKNCWFSLWMRKVIEIDGDFLPPSGLQVETLQTGSSAVLGHR